MRVILTGCGEMFRALAEGILNSGHEIAGVFLNENVIYNSIERWFLRYYKPSGCYLFVKSLNLHEIKARSVNSNAFRKAVKELQADAVITGSWSEKFSLETISTIPEGFINVHPSLLPAYRGPNPYIQTLLHNEKFSGVTFHLMDADYDTGPVLYQKKVPILHNDTGGSLRLRCCSAARSGIGFLLDNFEESLSNQKDQNGKNASYQPRISLKETIIEFQKETSFEIDRRIRALSPWYQCFLPYKGEFFSFDKHEITKEKSDKPAGTILKKTENEIYTACLDNNVMKFSNLQIKRPFSGFISKLFWDKLIKAGGRAV